MQLLRIVLHAHQRNHYGQPEEEQQRAALLMYLVSTLVASAMSVFGKLCTGAGMHFFQLVAVRSAVLCVLVVPSLWRHRVNPFALTDT